ncbi:MAG: hypothetical protein IT385_25430 [Deltaproteobacteria bacterium]|nr:hypothetical protein [Deltaproteobacteria bacterium]
MRRALAVACLSSLAACGDDEAAKDAVTDATSEATSDVGDVAPEVTTFEPIAGPRVRMDFTRADGFFAAPFPSLESMASGVSRWPSGEVEFVAGLVELATLQSGASLAGGVFFTLSEAPAGLAEALPTGATRDGPIRLRPLSDAGALGAATPVTLRFEVDGGPFGAPNLLSALPVQGIPLAPGTTWVATVARAPLGLGRGPELAALLSGALPIGADPEYLRAIEALAAAGEDLDELAGLAVFRTGDPTFELDLFVHMAKQEPPPDLTGLALVETFDRYCVYTKEVDVPDYQSGALPFTNAGEGVWLTGPAGGPILQRRAPTRLFVTVPRAPAPAAGYPTVVFIRTGGGGDRPLIDRGPRATHGGEPIVPTGTGPAMHLAAAGWAAITWDGPHGGPRNPTRADEQFLMFNVLNPGATRDNVRQTALEAIVVESWLDDLTIDGAGCPGASASVTFDAATTAIMGHSMGGWIAPMTLALGGFDAAILSGAGGSWIENVVHKLSPLAVRPLAETLLGYDRIGRTLHAHDPVLTLLQWVGESADPQAYAAAPPLAQGHGARDTHVLMIEGIVDTYILPPIANATALSLALDLAGPAHDETDARLAAFVPLGELLGLVGRGKLPLPASGNDGGRTRVVVQAPGDAIEDGHEAMFQTAPPKHQYRCFLADLAAGVTPVVRAGATDEWAACAEAR